MHKHFRVGGASRVANSFLFAFFVCLLTSCASSPTIDESGNIVGTVEHVIDGDTINASFNGRKETIRLIGVDTPETKHPTKPIECWGPEASAFTTSVLPKRTEIIVVRDAHARDKYGRLLAYVYRRRDMMFVNRELVRGGWARTLSIPPNTAFESVFERDLLTAQESQLGIWKHCPR